VIKLASWARSEVKEVCIIDEDGVVKVFNLEEGGTFTFSGADDMLKLFEFSFAFNLL
jgi:peroxiredoxin